jgi:hypothetical protein
VLVTPSGRVVLLDFGIATDQRAIDSQRDTETGAILGTIVYMSPEQAAGQPASAASDWYSVGVMLYEALTGLLPFRGTGQEVLRDKQILEPLAPVQVAADIPEDLSALCMRLLSRDATTRPSAADIIRQLGRCTSTVVAAAPPPASGAFIGREPELAMLREALDATKQGRMAAACVKGRSGVGKSALIQRFLDEVRAGDEALILIGRCYEHESVPYKALDGLMDALSQYLRRLPLEEGMALLPRNVLQLARLFPVLRRVEAIARAPGRDFVMPDPQELRRRAFAALRELLARLGDRHTIVLWIDDLQWGDLDSAALLTELMRPPDAPALLFLGSFRSEDEDKSPFLRSFLSSQAEIKAVVQQRLIHLETLSPAEATRLALALLGQADPRTLVQAEVIARESTGNPFFVQELVQHASPSIGSDEVDDDAKALTLDDVLWARVLRLPTEARRLLEVIAVASQPLREAEACAASQLSGDQRSALALLRTGRLLRLTGSPGEEEIETYHDRVRETVVNHLTPQILSTHHHRLARILEKRGRVDPEILAFHFQGAGEQERAGHFYRLAAVQAGQALAFDRAARLYGLALDAGAAEDSDVRELRIGLADALANAGRGAEAAREYLAATTGAAPELALELQRRAAFQFLSAGHADEGIDILRLVLRGVGMSLARTPGRALLSLLVHRVQLWLRGIRFRERQVNEVAPTDLMKIDVTWDVGRGVGMIDPIRGSEFQTRNVLLALRAGEPVRVARALAAQASYFAAEGGRAQRRAAQFQIVAEEIAGRTADPYALGLTSAARGLVEYLNQRWRCGLEASDRADTILRERCTNVTWELDTAHVWALWCLINMGGLADLRRRCNRLLQEAQEKGDLYALTYLRTSILTTALLAADEPEQARRHVREALAAWSQQGYHLQHYHALWAEIMTELYCGNGWVAWEQASKQWKPFARSLLVRIQQYRIELLQWRAYAAIAAATEASDARTLLRHAGADAARLHRERRPAARAFAQYIDGMIAAVRGDAQVARRLLADTAKAFDELDMQLYAAATRWRLGELIGGGEGRKLVATADAWMSSQKIQCPSRMSAVFAPGGNGTAPTR